jgi:hypothetical protein
VAIPTSTILAASRKLDHRRRATEELDSEWDPRPSSESDTGAVPELEAHW